MEKNIRFGDLVRKSGRPQAVTLWTDPNKDRALSQAVRQNRVLTVLTHSLTKRADFGLVGFHERPKALYLVFPRPLPQAEDSRIIGINYELLDELDVSPRTRSTALRAPELPPKPVEKTFAVKLRRTATIETTMNILAKDRKTAAREALTAAKNLRFQVEPDAIRDQVVAVE